MFQWCPYFRGVHVSGVSIFQGCHISGVSIFQGCPYFRGVHISGVSLFPRCPYRGSCKTLLIVAKVSFRGAGNLKILVLVIITNLRKVSHSQNNGT